MCIVLEPVFSVSMLSSSVLLRVVQTLSDPDKRVEYDQLMGFSEVSINPFRDTGYPLDQVGIFTFLLCQYQCAALYASCAQCLAPIEVHLNAKVSMGQTSILRQQECVVSDNKVSKQQHCTLCTHVQQISALLIC